MLVHAVYNISAIHRTSTRLKIAHFCTYVYTTIRRGTSSLIGSSTRTDFEGIYCVYNQTACVAVRLLIQFLCIHKKKKMFIYCTLSKFMKFPFFHILDNIRFSRLFEKLIFDACVSLLQLKWL